MIPKPAHPDPDPRPHPRRGSAPRTGALACAALLAALVAGCAAPGPGRTPPLQDLPTQSDQTDADRRARPRVELAEAFLARGQYATALDEIKQALAAKPDMPEALNLRGLIYGAMGETALAEESFRRALQVSPRNGAIMHNYGWFLCQNQRVEQAEAQFAQALAQPGYREVPRTLLAQGVCEARSDRLVEAEASLTRAMEMEPGNPAVAYNLAEVLLRRGDYERARFHIRRVNSQVDLSNAQSLWLAVRIERRIGNLRGAQQLGDQLRSRFPQSPEAAKYDKGQWND